MNIQQGLQEIIKLHSQRRLQEAEILCRKILDIEPNNPDANNFLGVIAYDVGNFPAARAFMQKAIDQVPTFSGAYLNMGNIVQKEGDVEGSVHWYEKAIHYDPKNKKAHSNLGVALTKTDHLHKAVAHLKEAIDLDPGYIEATVNISEAYKVLGEYAKAFDACNQVLSMVPDHVPARWNRSILLLLDGNFETGLAEYEWRWKRPQSPKREIQAGSEWGGQPLDGKTIFIYEEQGLGDTLQFARYLPLLQQLNGKVIFEILPSLVRLFSSFEGADRLWVGIRDKDTRATDRFDYHLPLMSLPKMFNTRLDSIPSKLPYLKADTRLVSIWQSRMQNHGGVRIGIVWAGHPSHKDDARRSIPLSLFASLKLVPGVKLYSLQKEKYAKWTDEDPESVFEQDFGPEISDFADTAAIMENLDLIISVDTSVVHLAGALGKNTWVLLPHSPDWRWMTERKDSPWYPTMKLFRQKDPGDWIPVFKAVRHSLENI